MIRISGLSRQVGDKKVLSCIDLDIRKGEIFTLIGPSGSGKTSLIRLIDLLDRPTSGTILFDGEDTRGNEQSRLLLRRRIALVFQKPAVLNTTVAENVSYSLRFRGVEQDVIHSRIKEALGIVGLGHLADRRAVTLSGGEMQRVAIARALVTQPEVLLLDEPTANLDPVNAGMIEDLIIRINRTFHTTIIMATHDMIQGQRLADRIGVIIDGQLVQTGTTNDIFYQPAGWAVARLVGIDTVLHGIVKTNDRGHAEISVGDAMFEAITSHGPGTRVALYIRPEEVTITVPEDGARKTSMRNQLSGTITKIVPLGPFIRITVDSGSPITALITRRSCQDLNLGVGSPVTAGVKATAIHVLPDEVGIIQ
jgi:tungstate transport system ATP-binding protein